MDVMGRYRKGAIAIALSAAALLAGSPAHAGTGGAIGDGDLTNGTHVRVITGAAASAVGFAWIADQTAVQEVTLDCVDITPVIGPYPFPPYGLYNVLYASGITTDGARVYITIADFGATNRGQRDLLQVATTAGSRVCGAREDALNTVTGGDFIVTP